MKTQKRPNESLCSILSFLLHGLKTKKLSAEPRLHNGTLWNAKSGKPCSQSASARYELVN